MKKFLKILANIGLFLNLVAGYFAIFCIIEGKWYFLPLFIIFVLLNFKFYFYAFRKEHAEFDRQLAEIKKTHTYVGSDEYGDVWYYENNETGEVIEF